MLSAGGPQPCSLCPGTAEGSLGGKEHPSRYPGGTLARRWRRCPQRAGSARGPHSVPLSISLSFFVCREGRIDPERADPGGRAVLKVQNLLDTSSPDLGAFSLHGWGGPLALRLSWPAGSDTSLAPRSCLPSGILWGLTYLSQLGWGPGNARQVPQTVSSGCFQNEGPCCW